MLQKFHIFLFLLIILGAKALFPHIQHEFDLGRLYRQKSFPIINSLNKTGQDPILKTWRKESLFTSRQSKKTPAGPLPKCQFALYRVKAGDTLWKIISLTALDLDTIAQVNRLSSVHDIKENDLLFIPNMRGSLRPVPQNKTLKEIAQKHGIPLIQLLTANEDILKLGNNWYLFIPSGKFSTLERALFFGTAFLSPLFSKSHMTSLYGMRKDPFTDQRTFHGGIDIAAPVGTPVYASRKGKVIFSGWSGNYGRLVVIEHSLGYQTYYGHLQKINVSKGMDIATGKNIGLIGSSGKSTGPHLHFEIRRSGKSKNPLQFLKGWKKYHAS
jgi:murein DD-endopeptidase MepM/ murein hydrolase activator NlpD